MKKLATVLLGVLVACRSAGGPGASAKSAGSVTGGSSPDAALAAYMSAVKAKDLQAMSAAWGSARGPARETMDRVQMEKSETIVMSLFCQDDYKVLGQQDGLEGRKLLQVELKRRTNVMQVRFTTIKGPANRWYVEDVDLKGEIPKRMQTFCR